MIIIGEYQLAEVWLVSFCLKATRQAENEPLIIERYSNNIQRDRNADICYPCDHA